MSNQLVKHISSWAVPDLLEIPAKAIVFFLLVNLLDKETFAMLNLAMMVFSYHAITQFGVSDWLMYELPKKFSMKKNIQPVLESSFNFSLINQLIIFLFLVLFLLFFSDNLFINIAIPAYMMHTLIYNSYLHKTLFLRYKYKFDRLLKLRVFFIIVRFILEVSALIFFGIYAYLAIEAIIFLVPLILLKDDLALNIKLNMTLKKYKSLAMNGAPFFVVTLLTIMLGNMDRWFIVSVYGLEWFATYSVGIFIVTVLLIVPGKVLSISTQYLKELFIIIHDRNLNIIRSFSVNNFLLLLLLMVLITIGNTFEYLVLQYLSKYKAVTPLINVLILSILLKYSVSLSSNVLYLLDRRGDVAKIQVFTTALYIIVLSAIYYQDYDILSVLWGVNFVLLTQIIINLLLIFTLKDFDFNLEILRFSMLILIAFSYYFLNDFFVFIVPWYIYIMMILFVCIYNFKSMWESLSYVSTRSFEKDLTH